MAVPVVAACFIILCICSVIIALGSAIVGACRAQNKSLPAAFIIVPLSALLQAYENAALAYAAAEQVEQPLDWTNARPHSVLRSAVQSWVVPTLMIALCELAITVYKARSFPFGCLHFDSGVPEGRVAAVRSLAWLWAAALHFLLQVRNAAADQPGGCTTGCSRFLNGRLPVTGPFDAADVLPPASLLAVGLFIGRALWVYGTTASTDVHPSSLNVWAATFVSTLALTFSYFLTPSTWQWPLAVNISLTLLTAALALTVHLVQLNREHLGRWRAALDAAHEAEIAQAAMAEQALRLSALAEDALIDGQNNVQEWGSRRSSRASLSKKTMGKAVWDAVGLRAANAPDMTAQTGSSKAGMGQDQEHGGIREYNGGERGTASNSRESSSTVSSVGDVGDDAVQPDVTASIPTSDDAWPGPAEATVPHPTPAAKSPVATARGVSAQTREKTLQKSALRGGGIVVVR